MSRLNPDKLHVRLGEGITSGQPLVPRCYTLTHSDRTGELFLTVAPAVNQEQVSGWYTRFMRDEVVAEWKEGDDGPALHVYCFVSGGFVVGGAAMRYAIFRRELALVLEAFRFGDKGLFCERPELDQAPVLVHYRSGIRRYQITERWGTLGEYRV